MTEQVFVERFFKEHENYVRVDRLEKEQKEKVIWAGKENFIYIRRLPMGVLAVRQKDIEIAEMWWEKRH